ncbi:MAG: hypothetical protein HOH65_12600 [Rhodospirillaceae bacterium]|nr:hypothetical protein [Rhodospirillaceae bacterium]
MTLRLAGFGSFHVGGRVHDVRGEPVRRINFTPTAALDHDPNGRFTVEQAYVQYFIPEQQREAPPLLLVHGGGLTGAMWETTPDGRPGWLHHFLDAGFATYVIDNVERGRSGFPVDETVWDGKPIARSDREAWSLFRFGRDADFEARIPLPGQRFPLAHYDALLASFVPRWTSTTQVQVAGLIAAMERIGPCTLVCHSHGGDIGSRAAMARPDLVAGFVSVEGTGFPPADAITPETVAGKPWLYLMGDYLDLTPLWQGLEVATRETVERLVAAGGSAEYLDLPEHGFPGSTHMMMMDENSDEIARWLVRRLVTP